MTKEQYKMRYQAMTGLRNEFNHFDAHIYDTKRKEAILISTCCRDHNEALNQSIEIAKVWNSKYTVDLDATETKSIKIRNFFNLDKYLMSRTK